MKNNKNTFNVIFDKKTQRDATHVTAQDDTLSRPTTAWHVSFSWARGRVSIGGQGLCKWEGTGRSRA